VASAPRLERRPLRRDWRPRRPACPKCGCEDYRVLPGSVYSSRHRIHVATVECRRCGERYVAWLR